MVFRNSLSIIIILQQLLNVNDQRLSSETGSDVLENELAKDCDTARMACSNSLLTPDRIYDILLLVLISKFYFHSYGLGFAEMDRSRYSVRAAERVLRILKNFNLEQPERGYATVAEETNIPQTTVFKLMNVMAEEGFLEETGRKGRYRIGLEAYRVGNLYLVDKRLIEVAGPWLQRLAERLGMTANLGVRSGDVALRVLSEQGTSRLSLTVQLGESMPLSASGLGKALVLDMEEVELAQLLPPSPWHQLTANSFVDIPQLWADLRLSEERGYTLDDEEGTVGIRCLGFPIRNRAGEIIAAISVTGTTIEITDESLPGIIRAVKTFGLNISTELGYHSS